MTQFINFKMNSVASKSSLDNLPPQFISAMRTLFNIMDDKRTGFIKLSDIQSRWQDDETKGLPKGVVDSLLKVTPPNGLLSFERFCAGLKICLLRNKNESTSNTNFQVPNNNQSSEIQRTIPHKPPPSFQQQNIAPRPQSVPADRLMRDRALPILKTLEPRQRSVQNLPVVHPSAIKTNPTLSRSRTVSMPHLGDKPLVEKMPQREGQTAIRKPPNTIVPKGNKSNESLPFNTVSSRSDIMTTLHNWHMGLKANSESNLKRMEKLNHVRPPADGRAVGPDLFGGITSDVDDANSTNASPYKKRNNRRREPRRHTLASGIDYNMLKRMKQLEQEKDVLLQGLEAVDKSHDWYLKQISIVQEKMKYIGKTTCQMDYSTEAHQEKLNFQMARIFEVNQHLSALIESSERGFPMHMNLEVPYVPLQRRMSGIEDNTMKRLKEQNHLLTEEISRKSERITQLEREKSALIRELFQARTHNRHEVSDTTFL